MQVYRPSGFIPFQGMLLLLVAIVVGGIALGVITHLIAQVVYFVLVFPIVMGMAAGGVIAAALYFGRVRSPLGGGICGVMIALVLYSTFRYAEYRFTFRSDLRDEIESAYGSAISNEDYTLQERLFLKDETGSQGLVGYVKLEAKYGVSFSQAGTTSSASTTTLKGTLAYLYWLIEIAIVAGFASLVAIRQGRHPFSEEANEWFGPEQYLASVRAGADETVRGLLQRGDFASLAPYLVVESLFTVPRVDLVVRRTSSPAAAVMACLHQMAYDRRKQVRTRRQLQGLIPPGAYQTVVAAIQKGMG